MGSYRFPIVGACASLGVLVSLSLLTGVDVEKIAAVGIPSLALASAISISRLFAQAIRFHALVRGIQPAFPARARSTVLFRLASEFVAMSTVAYIGGELVRAAWLTRKGLATGISLWIAYLEVMMDVLVGVALSSLAAAYALAKGGILLGTAILVIVLPVLAVHLGILFLARRGKVSLPSAVKWLIPRILDERRGARFLNHAEATLAGFSAMAKNPAGVWIVGLGMTSLLPLTAGLSFLLVFQGSFPGIDLFTATLAVYASIGLATLPVSLGGSGLSELGAFFYLASVVGATGWASIVAWRIVSYHVPLIATAVALILMMLKKMA